jgi:hypothetical protein
MLTSLRYSLYAENAYVQGQPIIIRFGIENVSSSDVWILKWYTPLEGIKGKIFEVSCDGADIPYEGMLMKRGNPGKDDYLLLHPNKPVEKEFDLSSVYSIPACKECRVNFKGRIFDVVFHHNQIPRSAELHQPVEVLGNSVLFSITSE